MTVRACICPLATMFVCSFPQPHGGCGYLRITTDTARCVYRRILQLLDLMSKMMENLFCGDSTSDITHPLVSENIFQIENFNVNTSTFVECITYDKKISLKSVKDNQ